MPFLPFVLAAMSPSAFAAEVQFDGFYRARGRAFDNLTLDRDNPQAEGFTLYAEHRLWLAPLTGSCVSRRVVRGSIRKANSSGSRIASVSQRLRAESFLKRFALQSPWRK